jgi:hypothetical protein
MAPVQTCASCHSTYPGTVDRFGQHICADFDHAGYGLRSAPLRVTIPERTPDGHPQVWCLYRPEPFAPWSDDDRSIHLWVRRADVFTSRVVAIAFLDNLLGYQVTWKEYNEAFPELWIGWARGDRWLLCPAPVDPPGGKL